VLIVIVSVSLFAGSLQIDEIGERVEETVDRIMYKDITDVYNFIDSALDKVVVLKGYTDRLGSAEQTSELLEKQVELMDSIYEDFKRLSGMRPKIEKNFEASFRDLERIVGAVESKITTERLEKEKLAGELKELKETKTKIYEIKRDSLTAQISFIDKRIEILITLKKLIEEPREFTEMLADEVDTFLVTIEETTKVIEQASRTIQDIQRSLLRNRDYKQREQSSRSDRNMISSWKILLDSVENLNNFITSGLKSQNYNF
jgi:hypothetical protein